MVGHEPDCAASGTLYHALQDVQREEAAGRGLQVAEQCAGTWDGGVHGQNAITGGRLELAAGGTLQGVQHGGVTEQGLQDEGQCAGPWDVIGGGKGHGDTGRAGHATTTTTTWRC